MPELSAPASPPTGWFARIFSNRSVFLLWAAQLVSQAGDALFEIALLWMMLELTGSATATGLAAMAGYLPALVFGLWGGALADRFDPRRLMLISDGARALIAFAIPALYLTGHLGAVNLWLLTFVLSSFNAIFNPARDAWLPRLVPAERLLGANSLIQTSWQVASLVGPVLAGVLIPLTGLAHLFTVDGLTFVGSFLFLLGISARDTRPVVAANERLRALFSGALADVKAGLAYARKDRRVGGLLLITALDNLFLMGPAIAGMPLFVQRVLHADATAYALVQIPYAVGMGAGTAVLNLYGRKWPRGRALLWGIILDGVSLFPLLWVRSVAGTALVLLVHSFCMPLIVITRPTIVQTHVPAEFQGRVFGMLSVAVAGFSAMSMAATGLVAEVVPLPWLFALFSLAAAATGVLGFLFRDLRES